MTALVIRPSVVARSLARLRNQKTHTQFAGYLCLQQRAAQLGRLDDLRPNFTQFYKQFLEVENHPLGTPYIKIFTEQAASERNLWLNDNVAGPYSPAALRPNQPFRRVVRIEEREYSLPADHAALARVHLLYEKPIQVADLAVVLYRDYGFVKEGFEIQDLIASFAYEFGYADRPGALPSADFRLLFSSEGVESWDDDWLVVS